MRSALFPSPLTCEIPTPVSAQLGNEFCCLFLMDNHLSHMGFFAGCVFVFTVGLIREGLFHAVKTETGTGLIRFRQVNHRQIQAASFTGDLESGTYDIDTLPIVGACSELWPKGLSGPRCIFWQGKEFTRRATLSHLKLVANNP